MTPGHAEAPYQPGDRIELVHTDDQWTTLSPGDQGTVTFWNPAFSQLGVAWDNGSTLMMILAEGADQVRLAPRPPAADHPSDDDSPSGPAATEPPTRRPRRADPPAPATGPHPAAPPDSGAPSGPHGGPHGGTTPPTGPGAHRRAGPSPDTTRAAPVHPAGLVLPAGLAARPVCPRRRLPIPYVNTTGPDGWTDFTSIDTSRVVEVGTNNLCSLCGGPHG